MNVSILGGGAWGTTLAQTLTDNGNFVVIRDINPDFIDKINQEHVHPFFGMSIPQTIRATVSLSEPSASSDVDALRVPTNAMRMG